MAEEFLNGKVTLHSGDCLSVLDDLEENSIDSCCTDPPYHLTSVVKRFGQPNSAPVKIKLTESQSGSPYERGARGFMGKLWDGGDIAFQQELWAKVYRALKPGAHLLAFGGTRTFGKMQVAIEAAGFEVRDCIGYLFGSGFPKSHSINKKLANEICSCEKIPECDLRSLRDNDVSPPFHTCDERREVLFTVMPQQSSSSAMLRSKSTQGDARSKKSSVERWSDLSESPRELREREICSLPTGVNPDGAERRLCDGTSASDGPMDSASVNSDGVCSPHRSSAVKQSTNESGTVAGQSESQERGAWDYCGRCGKPIIPDGLGTALKPAMELIVLARKPLSESTVAGNVLRWGTGALNIDGCRVATAESLNGGGYDPSGKSEKDLTNATSYATKVMAREFVQPEGRWPANVIHDGSEEVVAAFPETQSGTLSTDVIRGSENKIYGKDLAPAGRKATLIGYESNNGSAARFFYTAKADSDDRLGSKHPTVKPLDLMQYLVRLVTPPRGLVLDPFSGTGTTGEAAWREGFRAILIERESEYQADIRRRMALCLSGPDERAREAIKAKMKDKPVDHGPLFAETHQQPPEAEWDAMWNKPFDKPELVWGDKAKS